MAHLAVATGVSFGMVDDRPVFLDARRDRYAMLPPDLGSAFCEMLAQGAAPASLDPRLAKRLIATGLFLPSNTPRPIAPVAHRPATSGLSARSVAPFRVADFAQIWVACALAARSARRRPFHRLLQAPAVSQRAAGHCNDDHMLELVARRFHEARRFVPKAPACLADSLAMRFWLARHGHACSLVMAVRLEPFEAHCWLETAGMVLNDEPERIASFVPVGLFR